jgi:cation diffusion facilitator family transporter
MSEMDHHHEEVLHEHHDHSLDADKHSHDTDEHEHDHNHKYDHEHEGRHHNGHGEHAHEHGKVEAELYSNKEGLRAVQVATAGMLVIALIQFAIALVGGSAGLFADALHNAGDVLTTVALWIAFVVSNRAANARYTYGYHRAEDLAGIIIVLVIIISAIASAVESVLKLISGSAPTQIVLSMAAALVGVAGNELLAQYKISVGKRINSVPLVADGQHSRIDGLTSLAAFIGLIGVALGVRLTDPIAGLVITVAILGVVYSTTRSVLTRVLDAVDPHIIPEIIDVAGKTPGVEAITEPRARWVGHTLHIVLNIEVDPDLTLAQAHGIAEEVRHRLFHSIEGVSEILIHTDPASHQGDFHQLVAHHMQQSQQPVTRRR